MAWINEDGLKVRFDHEKIVRVEGGQYAWGGEYVTIEGEIDAVDIGTSATLIGDGIIVPRNFRVESVEVISETALDAITSLDIGLQRLDYTTELDYDGLVDAIVLASMNVNGEKTVLTAGVATAGVLVGATTVYPGRLTVLRTGGPATVGKLVIRVKGYVPGADANPDNF